MYLNHSLMPGLHMYAFTSASNLPVKLSRKLASKNQLYTCNILSILSAVDAGTIKSMHV